MVALAQTVAWKGHWVGALGQLVVTTGQTVSEAADEQTVSRAGHWVWVIGQDVDDTGQTVAAEGQVVD